MAEITSADDDVEPNAADCDVERLWPMSITTISESGYRDLTVLMESQLKAIEDDPKITRANFSRILSWYMNMMQMDPKITKPEDSCQLIPIFINQEGISPRMKVEIKRASLKILHDLVKQEKKSRLFSFWFAFMPSATISPYKSAIFDLLEHPDNEIQQLTMKLAQVYFDNSSTYLLLANHHCRTTSFTPVCYHFARSLRITVMMVCKCYDIPGMHCTVYCLVAKTLVILLEQVPFHRLEDGVIWQICNRLLRLKRDANPVVQIGVMQVCMSLMSIETNAKNEIKDVFSDFLVMFTDRMVPNAVMAEGVPAITPPAFELDYNICYFAVQCLGKLACLDLTLFMGKLDGFPLVRVLENVVKNEKSQGTQGYTLSLHMLRLFRTIGNSSFKLFDETKSEDTILLERVVKFWKEFLRPTILDLVEQKRKPILKAALCDCLSEIGEKVFSYLPGDRRILCITYLLQKCTIMDDIPENRVVTTSQVRAIGRCITWPTCNSDSAFVTDCAELVLDVLDRELHGKKFAHKNIALSGSWALANLAFALAMPGSKIDEDDEFLRSLSANNDQLEFPPHLTVALAKVAIKYAENMSNLMNIRTSCVRALGCFLRSLDCISTDIEGTFEDPEFIEVCRKVIETISLNASTGKAMKVRWNACYASANVLKPLSLYKSKELVKARSRLIFNLLPMVQDFPNYKVRMAACTAFMSSSSKDVFDGRFLEVVMTVVKALDTVHDLNDENEAKHRTALIDRIGLTICHLLALSDIQDLMEINRCLLEHTMDPLKQSLMVTINRISPEQGTVMLKAINKLKKVSTRCGKRNEDDLFHLFQHLEERSCIGMISPSS